MRNENEKSQKPYASARKREREKNVRQAILFTFSPSQSESTQTAAIFLMTSGQKRATKLQISLALRVVPPSTPLRQLVLHL